MSYGFIINQDGFRGDTFAVTHRRQGGVYIGAHPYRLEPTEETTLPEEYVVCDVYDLEPYYEGDDGRMIWQIAISPTAIEKLRAER